MKMEETKNHVPTSFYVSSFGENDLVSSSSPKIENFLGGAKMAAHHYGNHEMEKVALSLDSIYYQQQNVNNQEAQTQNSLHILQQPQEEEMQYFLGMPCHQMYQTSHVQETRDIQMTDWISGPFSASAASGSVGSMGCGELQSLSLSMSPGSQSSSVTALRHISPAETHSLAVEETKKRGFTKMGTKQPGGRKSIDTFGQRTSQYRGVTRHRWTGRYEAHLWDNSCKKEGQTRKGRQVYLGGYDMEEKAARAYDCAALKYWGPLTHINFPLENYQQQIEDMKSMSRQEYVAHLRRKSSGFSRGASIYRGVTRHHQHGRWQARIGRVAGNKDLYLGTFSTQEEAAEAYDIAAIKFRGVNAVTNFDIKRYDTQRIMASNSLLAGEEARRITDIEPRISEAIVEYMSPTSADQNKGDLFQANGSSNWKMVLHQSPQSLSENKLSIGYEQQQQHYNNLSFSSALQNMMQIESVNSTQLMLHNVSSTKNDHVQHFSDPSSQVTSLSSSREVSPDRTSSAAAPMLFAKTTTVGSWISSAQLRPAQMSMSHSPVFATCNSP